MFTCVVVLKLELSGPQHLILVWVSSLPWRVSLMSRLGSEVLEETPGHTQGPGGGRGECPGTLGAVPSSRPGPGTWNLGGTWWHLVTAAF